MATAPSAASKPAPAPYAAPMLSPPSMVDPAPAPGTGKTDWASITGLIIGIISWFGLLFAAAGIVFSILGLNRTKKDPSLKGRGMAIAGLVLSCIGAVLGVVFLVYFIQHLPTK